MDDSMDSVVNEKEGISLYKQLSGLWEKAGMHAHKWLSNSKVVFEVILPQDRASQFNSSENPRGKQKKMFLLLSKNQSNHILNQSRKMY